MKKMMLAVLALLLVVTGLTPAGTALAGEAEPVVPGSGPATSEAVEPSSGTDGPAPDDGGAPEYTRIEFHDPVEDIVDFLAETGIIANLISEEPIVTADVNPQELADVDEAGIGYTVLIEDVSTFYAQRAAADQTRFASDAFEVTLQAAPVAQPANFEVSPPGSMGGFYTYSQILDELDQMVALRPDLITVRQSIGTTLEGRPIYMVKISDNPNTDEAEPEVFYNSMTHAREPMAFTQNLFYMWHMLENYDTDPDIKNIIDNTEMYFVPVINVDGYLYNESTNPNGGGLWRKNRRNNGDGTFGIDLNRNFGYQWGYDNQGSSPVTSSNTYRGTGPFSEPETQVVRDFVNARDFVLALNYHSAVGLLLYPFGYDINVGVADSRYPVLGELLTRDNGYPHGTGVETLYAVNGESTDWMYGSAGVLAFVPEVGPDDFWPAPSQIVGLAQEWVETNKMLARVAGVWADAANLTSSSPVAAGSSGQVDFSIQRKGIADGPFTVTVTGLTANVTSTCAPQTISGLAYDAQTTGSCSYDVAAGAIIGDPVQLEIAINNGDYDIHTFVVNTTVADPNSLSLLDASFDTGTDGFTYSDDTFRNTNEAAYESGQWNSTGGFSGGGVEVALGGINNNDIFGMSGGWTSTFTLAQPSDLTLSLRYDLRQEGTEEADELSQALVAIDGALIGNPPNDYLAQLAGDGNSGPPIVTGWQQDSFALGTLGAGSHTITIGGYSSKKTLADETTTIVFDDVSLVAAGTNAAPTASASATPTTGTTPLAVNFDGNGSSDSDGTITSYAWDFGDGNGDSGATGAITPTPSAGVYTVTLTVTDNDGCDPDVDTATITVDPRTTASHGGGPLRRSTRRTRPGLQPWRSTSTATASSDGDGTITS